MTNEQILEKQVDALEKLLQIKEAIIQEQEARISKLERDVRPNLNVPYTVPRYFNPNPLFPSAFSNPCPNGQNHEYDFPWLSTSPQPCKKCGQVTQFTVTSGITAVNDVLATNTIPDIINNKNV